MRGKHGREDVGCQGSSDQEGEQLGPFPDGPRKPLFAV